ncbi:MAG TPA: PHP domain-containing protein [Trueperaceae bacterium]
MVTRKDIAAQLNETAKLLEVVGEDDRRARSLYVMARAFEAYQGDVGELYREGKFTSLRGVGASTEAELNALFEQGIMPSLARLREQVPEEVRELFAVSGLGAKRIGLLWRSRITGLEELLRAAEDGRLAALPGLGAKSAAKIADSARFALRARERMRLDEAHRLAEAIVSALQAELDSLERIEVAGEFRRGLETVGELELVIAGPEPAELARICGRLLDEVDEASPYSGRLMGRRISFTPAATESFGAMLALRTGSSEFVETLLVRAEQKGFSASDLETIEAPDEEAFLESLGLGGIAPELRESVSPTPVADLVELSGIRGAIHNHSTWSDGALSLREMVKTARGLGFSYLAMADHSRSSTVANGLSPERVLAQAREVEEIRRELESEGDAFELLHGIEVDILPDGTLDLPDELLARLDYTVASVHQNFGLSEAEQTARVVRAVRNPYVHILAHPTGRLLLRRPGYEIDLEAVIEACAASGTVIEINANPRRLDLDWRWVSRARELGCKFSIDPDAHSADGYDDIRYGVTVARKAGLTGAEVINTAPTGREFLSRLPRS